MNYGATESNSREGAGIALLIAGLAALSAGWAYGIDAIQIVAMLVGVIALAGGFVVLRSARVVRPT